MLPDRIHVHSIVRIVYVSADEYREKILRFDSRYAHNELIYHLGGDATVHFNGVTLQTVKGTLRYLPQGDITEYWVDRREIGGCLDIVFDSDVPLSPQAFTLDVRHNKKLEALFHKAFSVWSSRGDGYYVKAMSLIYEILDEIYGMHYVPSSKTQLIEPALQFISEQFLQEDISVSALAELCGISESYLKKLFLERCGVPPKKYIINLKMQYALDLLSSEMLSIGRIAEILRYDNIYYFSKAFKKNFGLSPTEYIKKCKSSK